jgi:hypothetical protein
VSFDLLRKFRSLATLSVLGVLMLVGVTWGWSAATSPLPDYEDPPICDNTTLAVGDNVYPDQVTVSVINAGGRDGLASQTMEQLVAKGFFQGSTTNGSAEAKVNGAEIWTDDPDSAAVRLVATYLAKNGKGVTVKEQEPDELGINVVVGDGFEAVVTGRKSIAAKSDATICSPPVSDE